MVPTGAGGMVGFDLSPRILTVACAISVRDGLSVARSAGRAEALPLADGDFDLVLLAPMVTGFKNRSNVSFLSVITPPLA